VPFVDGLEELEGRPIGVVRGHAFAELLRVRYPRLQFVEVDNEIDGLKRLQRGELHGYVSTLLSASHHLHELGLADIKVIGRVPGDWALSVATRNDEPMLLTVAQKMIDSLTDADRRTIEDNWRAVRLEPEADYTLIWRVLLGALAGLAVLIVWNRKLGALNRQLAAANSQLARLNVTDGLTGVGNRSFFDQEFEKSFRWCQRNQVGFVVAMIDIDHFKRINDTYGHQVGDDCLKALAGCLKTHARRETDHVARIGGEEFVAFSTYEDANEACARFEALRIAVSRLRMPAGDDEISLTISIGVATGVPTPTQNANEFLSRADRALYEAKRTGRNRSVFSEG
jgi:polar amino acid transport system substrate-binding protein